MRDGGGSIVAYEAWLATRDAEVLEAIRRYSAEDCQSTSELYRWLIDVMRPAAAIQLGADFDELAKPEVEDKGEPHFMAELRPVLDRLLAGIPEGEDVELDADRAERRPTVRPQYWHWFAMCDILTSSRPATPTKPFLRKKLTVLELGVDHLVLKRAAREPAYEVRA